MAAFFPLFAFAEPTARAQLEAAAGTEVGNGGNAIMCDAGPTKTYEVLDFWEARELQKMHLDLGPETSSMEAKLNYVIERLAKRDTRLAARLGQEIEIFLKRHEIIPRVRFPDTKDAKNIFIPDKNCELHQLAIRDERYFNGGGQFYFIKHELWQFLSPTERAGLALHEAMYRLSGRQDDSTSVRYLVGYISSSRMNDDNMLAYMQAVRGALVEGALLDIYPSELPIPYTETQLITSVHGYELVLDFQSLFPPQLPVYFFENGAVKKAILLSSKKKISLKHSEYRIRPGSFISFYQDGALKEVTLLPAKTPLEVPFAGYNRRILLDLPIQLYPSGAIKSFSPVRPVEVTLSHRNVPLSTLEIDENGDLRGGELSQQDAEYTFETNVRGIQLKTAETYCATPQNLWSSSLRYPYKLNRLYYKFTADGKVDLPEMIRYYGESPLIKGVRPFLEGIAKGDIVPCSEVLFRIWN